MYVAELRTRKYRAKMPRQIRKPEDVARLLGNRFWKAAREQFAVLLLTTRHTVLAIETVSVGTIDASIVHPREVFRPAIRRGAKAILCAHNHPSGDPEPSADDVEITERLAKVGELLGTPVLDHIVIAAGGLVSFQSRGLLPRPE
jgi:DNA repair protein RadC